MNPTMYGCGSMALALALEPVADDQIETRELFQSEFAQTYVGRVQRPEEIRRGQAV